MALVSLKRVLLFTCCVHLCRSVPVLNLLGLVSNNRAEAPLIKQASLLAAEQVEKSLQLKVNITWVDEGKSGQSNDILSFMDAVSTRSMQYHGILGPHSNNVCENLLRISQQWSLVAISYACNAESLSSYGTLDSAVGVAFLPDYPFFARTVNRHSAHASAWSDVALHFAWKQIVVISEDGEEYARARQSFLKAMTANSVMNISTPQPFKTVETMSHALDLAKGKSLRIIVANMGPSALAKMLCLMKQKDMTSWDWVIIGELNDATQMSLVNDDKWGSLCSSEDRLSVAANGFWTGEPTDTSSTNQTISQVTSGHWQAASVHEAVWSWAHTAKNSLKANPNILKDFTYKSMLSKMSFLGSLHSTKFQGVTGNISFQSNKALKFNAGFGSMLDRTGYLAVRRLNTDLSGKFVDTAAWLEGKGLLWTKPVRWSAKNATKVYDSQGSFSMGVLKARDLVPDSERKRRCMPGYRNDVSNSSCVACEIGRFSQVWDASSCEFCAPGKVSGTAGLSMCSSCQPGSLGASHHHCDLCPLGKYQQEAGQTACSNCKKGSYADAVGLKQCTLCAPSLTSLDQDALALEGSESRLQCMCKAGQFFTCATGRNTSSCRIGLSVAPGMYCSPCPGGFGCTGGQAMSILGNMAIHSQPKVLKAHYAKASAPLEAYACREAQNQCIGGGVDMCGGGRSGLQCSQCAESAWAKPGKQCEKCSNSAADTFLPFASLALVFIVACHMAYNTMFATTASSTGEEPRKSGIVATVVSIALGYLQLYAMLSSMNVQYPASVGDVAKTLTPLLFDLKPLASVCYFGDSLEGMYFSRAFVPLLMCALYIIAFGICRIVARLVSKFASSSIDGLFNTCGFALTSMSLAVATSVLHVFECAENPSAKKTLLHFEGHLCDADSLAPVVPVAVVLGMLYILGGLSAVFAAAWCAPSRFVKSDRFRARFAFLLMPWHPKVWYWGALIVLRNVLVALIPVVTTNGILQCLLVLCSFGSLFVAALHSKPWRSKIGNLLDSAAGLFFVVTLICSFALTPRTIYPLEIDADPFDARASLMTVVSMVYPKQDAIGAEFDRLAARARPNHPFLASLSVVALIVGAVSMGMIIFYLMKIILRDTDSEQQDMDALSADLVDMSKHITNNDKVNVQSFLKTLPERDLDSFHWAISKMNEFLFGAMQHTNSGGLKMTPSMSMTTQADRSKGAQLSDDVC